jgi:hypothetical protein
MRSQISESTASHFSFLHGSGTVGSGTVGSGTVGKGNVTVGRGTVGTGKVMVGKGRVTVGRGSVTVGRGTVGKGRVMVGRGGMEVRVGIRGGSVTVGSSGSEVSVGKGNGSVIVGSGNIEVGVGGSTVPVGSGGRGVMVSSGGPCVRVGNGTDSVTVGSGGVIGGKIGVVVLVGDRVAVLLGRVGMPVGGRVVAVEGGTAAVGFEGAVVRLGVGTPITVLLGVEPAALAIVVLAGGCVSGVAVEGSGLLAPTVVPSVVGTAVFVRIGDGPVASVAGGSNVPLSPSPRSSRSRRAFSMMSGLRGASATTFLSRL